MNNNTELDSDDLLNGLYMLQKVFYSYSLCVIVLCVYLCFIHSLLIYSVFYLFMIVLQ